jgi:hypothetical protein
MTTKKIVLLASIFIVGAIASVFGLTVHILMHKQICTLLRDALCAATILQPPYPVHIIVVAYFTVVLPGLGLAILYYFLQTHFLMAVKSKFSRAMLLAGLLLLLKGELIREPLMNILIGNPISVALLHQTHVWLTNFVMAILVVYLMPAPKISRSDPRLESYSGALGA